MDKKCPRLVKIYMEKFTILRHIFMEPLDFKVIVQVLYDKKNFFLIVLSQVGSKDYRNPVLTKSITFNHANFFG